MEHFHWVFNGARQHCLRETSYESAREEFAFIYFKLYNFTELDLRSLPNELLKYFWRMTTNNALNLDKKNCGTCEKKSPRNRTSPMMRQQTTPVTTTQKFSLSKSHKRIFEKRNEKIFSFLWKRFEDFYLFADVLCREAFYNLIQSLINSIFFVRLCRIRGWSSLRCSIDWKPDCFYFCFESDFRGFIWWDWRGLKRVGWT